jgi:crossover junction endodeoxyribonuclease RusA
VIRIHVAGDPRPKGSFRPIVSATTGRAFVKESGGANLKLWRQQLAAAIRSRPQKHEPLSGPVGVFLNFQLRRPQHPRSRWHVTRPDIDKLERTCLDALTGEVFHDDSQVVLVCHTKAYGEPGVDITVIPLDHFGVQGRRAELVALLMSASSVLDPVGGDRQVATAR